MDLTQIAVPSGTCEAYVARPPSGSGPGVLFFMDVIGIRPRIAEMCDRIASWGYVVMAPNVFHREGDVATIGPTGDLRDPDERQAFVSEAMPRLQRLTPDVAVPDIASYVAALRGLDGVTAGPFGVTGYCMGAQLSIRAATGHPDEVGACAGFHGARLATDDPDSPHLGLGSARAEFLFGHADHDGSNPAEAITLLGTTLDAHGLVASNQVYPGAPHGYSMSDTSAYDEGAAERHFDDLQELLARAL